MLKGGLLKLGGGRRAVAGDRVTVDTVDILSHLDSQTLFLLLLGLGDTAVPQDGGYPRFTTGTPTTTLATRRFEVPVAGDTSHAQVEGPVRRRTTPVAQS